MKKSSKSATSTLNTPETGKTSKEDIMQNANSASSANPSAAPAADADAATSAPKARAAAGASPKIRLVPVDGSEKPVMSNYVAFEATPGIVYIDFGFIEPAVITTLQRAAHSGAPLPEQINGRMAVRVAVGLDVLQNIHQQMGHVLTTLMENAQQQISTFNQLMQNKDKDAHPAGKAPAAASPAEMAEA